MNMMMLPPAYIGLEHSLIAVALLIAIKEAILERIGGVPAENFGFHESRYKMGYLANFSIFGFATTWILSAININCSQLQLGVYGTQLTSLGTIWLLILIFSASGFVAIVTFISALWHRPH